ncbi:MAG: phage tail protein [Kofleriaceae bacterium]
MTLPKRSYTAGHFELQIDNHRTTAYLRSVEGGTIKGNLIDEPIGSENVRVKHMSTVEIDPISIDFGLSGASDVLKWIQSTWRKDPSRRSGQITYGDFNLDAMYVREFIDALITETTFPALDGAAKEAAFLKVKIQPESVKDNKQPPKLKLTGETSAKQKLWSPSAFRFTIDGVAGMEYTNKIESLTIRQGIKRLYTGESRFPLVEPTKIEFPNIVGTIAEQHAGALLDWHESYVRSGTSDPKAQKTGSIEFLAPNKHETLFAIDLFDLGIMSVSMPQAQANSEQIKRIKFELYVGRMDLVAGAGFA